MTLPTDRIELVERIVVVIDICSSTKLVDVLSKAGYFKDWRNLILLSKKHLKGLGISDDEIYKFIGDGWILLFDPEKVPMESILTRLIDFARWFDEQLIRTIVPSLEGDNPEILGLTFGLHRGMLTRFHVPPLNEFVGRALNLACRFQGATKDSDKQPQYKLTISEREYLRDELLFSKFSREDNCIPLSNVNDGTPFPIIKLNLFRMDGTHIPYDPSKKSPSKVSDDNLNPDRGVLRMSEIERKIEYVRAKLNAFADEAKHRGTLGVELFVSTPVSAHRFDAWFSNVQHFMRQVFNLHIAKQFEEAIFWEHVDTIDYDNVDKSIAHTKIFYRTSSMWLRQKARTIDHRDFGPYLFE